MKDIKQYFVNDTKIVRKEIITDNSDSIMQQEDQEDIITTGKRRRVKIRISSNGLRRTCNVVESKNDLIDKTPSPLNSKINNNTIVQDATPKSCVTNAKQGFKKDSKLSTKTNASHKSKTAKNILKDKERLDDKSILDLDSSDIQHINIQNSRDTSNTKLQSDNDFQEESNAFLVLMNHNKPIQLLPSQQPVTDAKNKEKLDDIKDRRFQHKEKLIELANKKGYSKRRLAEIEESERVERIIEKRMSFFKSDNKDDTLKRSDSNELLVKSNKPGNLLDYFSKSPLKLTSKDEQCVTTFVVKADVHRTDNSDDLINTAVSNKIHFKKTNSSKSKEDISTIDDIHVIKSENLSLLHTTKENKQKREKTWSLRIKLHSPEDNNSSNDNTDDELFSPRSKSKLNMSRKFRKLGNTYEKNNMTSLKKNGHKHIKTIIENKEKEIESANDVVISNKNKDVDPSLEKSYENNQTKEQINNMSETIVSNDSDCEIINENVLKRKPNEKLAPLFIKRRKTDPVIAAAKQLFLHSDIIDVEIKSLNCKTNNSSISKFLYPTISHVTQLESSKNSTKLEIEHKFSLKIKNKYLPLININDYKCIINHEKLVRIPDMKSEPKQENLSQVLSEIEESCSDTRKLWKIISTIKSDSEKRSPSRMRNKKSRLLEQNKTVAGSEENKLHDCVWTCKYKPMSTQEIVGNEEAAGKLKTWLTGWRASLKTNNNDNSSDEFYSSDCSSSCNNENNQIAVLLGPHGSGKSASVYAIAEEFGYSVLEVNASSKRTGKRILKELEEATKSHRVKKNKHKFSFEQAANTKNKSKEPKTSHNSLILLEDIDLIFEEDEGFVSATYQLALNTKRPIVMTCRDMCPHLSKMAPQQNKIYFQKVNGNRVSVLLQLISLAEKGYRLPHNCLTKLLRAGDLRQALLQLQYLLLSGPPILSEHSMIIKSSLWQDVQYHLYKPVIKLDKKRKTEKKNTNMKKSNYTAYTLNKLADDLDNISLASSLLDTEDTTLSISEEKAQPNLSLTESVSFYSASRDLNTDIANFLSNQMLYKNSKSNENIQSQSNIILRKQLNRGVDQALSQVTSTCLDRRIMALDYLPAARTICRAEDSRFAITNKRGNRFFHYLHSLENVSAVWMKPNILAAACKTLQEKVNKTTALQT